MNKNITTAINIFGVAVAMFALAYASVPLYDLFCKVTGFGGTTQIAKKAPEKIYDRKFKVLLNADVKPELDWSFYPVNNKVEVKLGENKLVFFEAINNSDKPIEGMATYNVLPEKIGGYFNKIQCFCFERQLIKPKEKIIFPVSFFIDPEILKNKELDNITDLTLSYTFFPYKN